MKILLICHFFSSYMKDLIEQHYRYNGIIFDVATTDSSFKNKVNSKAIGNIYLFKDYQSFHDLISAVDYYDVIEIHFVDTFYSIYAELIRSKCEVLNCCVWGSDYYRVSEDDKNKQKNIYNLADNIIFGNPSTLSDFNEVFKYKEDKLKVCQFGLSVLEEIDAVTESDIEVFLEKYGIGKDKFIVTVGHNASPSQQHERIIKSLSNSKRDTWNSYHFVFPMTYGGTMDYVNKIKGILSDSYLNCSIITDFMESFEIAILRKCTNIFVHFQLTDQLSGSMQEHIYGESHIITGNWLPYKVFEEKNIFFQKIDSIEDELSNSILLLDKSQEMERIQKNKKSVFDMASWKYVSKKWFELYKSENLKEWHDIELFQNNLIQLLDKNRTNEVRNLLSAYENIGKKTSKYYSFLSSLLYSLGEVEEAFELLVKAIKSIKHDFDIWYNYTLISFELEKDDEVFKGLVHLYGLVKSSLQEKDFNDLVLRCNKNFFDRIDLKISYLIPVYNGEKFIKYSIDSIVNQKLKPYEIIVIDDCSTDSSFEILENYAKNHDNIKLIRHNTNKGPLYTHNELKELASGDYLKFLHQDDLLALDYSLMISAIPNIADYAFIVNDFSYSNQGITTINFLSKIWSSFRLNPNLLSNSELLKFSIINGNYFGGFSNILFNKHQFMNVPFNFEIDDYVKDLFTYLFLLKNSNVYFHFENLSFREEHGDNSTSKNIFTLHRVKGLHDILLNFSHVLNETELKQAYFILISKVRYSVQNCTDEYEKRKMISYIIKEFKYISTDEILEFKSYAKDFISEV